jgi:pimeloyl-ACP methyl ester carboxylesterase
MTLISEIASPRAFDAGRRIAVRNGTIELAVFEYGRADAETIILVHGWPDTHHLWSGVIDRLADRFRVVAYDLRGHGESTNPNQTSAFTLAELNKDLFAVIDAVSPDAPVHVVAHDWGSVIAWDAVCEPDAEQRIASFTSISGPNLDHLGKWVRDRFSRPTPRNLAGPLGQLASSAYTFFFMTPKLPQAVFRLAGSERLWSRMLWAMEGLPSEKLEFGDTLKQDMINGLRMYSANIFPRVVRNPRTRTTSVPVQLILNTRDVAVRPEGYDDTERWVDRLVRTEVQAGHWLPYSQPGVIADKAVQFIESVNEEGKR